MTIAIVLLVILLSSANGANDVPKGVATLAGAGVTRYRTAIVWGTFTTLAGCLCSLFLASKMADLFSRGIVSAVPTDSFALAVLCGSGAWILFATIVKLPVSSTHAVVGSLIGAGLLLAPSSVQFSALGTKVALPLLVSIVAAYAVSWALALIPERATPECICLERRDSSVVVVLPGSDTPTVAHGSPDPAAPVVYNARAGTEVECAVHGGGVGRLPILRVLHWATSGATSFARGLNDTPKLYAIGAFALVPAVLSGPGLLLLIAGTMAVGSLAGGFRVARRLGEGVIKMGHVEGFKANLTTSILVGVGANLGLPMSTTHVSTGAIAGAAGKDVTRLNKKTLRDFGIAWTVTPFVAGTVAATVYAVIG